MHVGQVTNDLSGVMYERGSTASTSGDRRMDGSRRAVDYTRAAIPQRKRRSGRRLLGSSVVHSNLLASAVAHPAV
jgi:hypothetical protein